MRNGRALRSKAYYLIMGFIRYVEILVENKEAEELDSLTDAVRRHALNYYNKVRREVEMLEG